MSVQSHRGEGNGVTFTGPMVVVCGLALAIFAAIRFWKLSAFCFDCDEVFSIVVARQDWSGLLRGVAQDVVHPPLFYLLLKCWVAIGGESTLWLRLFSVLTSIATLVPFLLLCRELRLRAVEISLALGLMAVNGFLVFYAHELRMYNLLQLLAFSSLWLFVKLLNAGAESKKLLAALFGVNLILIYTHYFGWMIVGVEFLFLLIWKRAHVALFSISVAALALCFSPWAVVVSRVAATNRESIDFGWKFRPGLADLAMHYATLNGLFEFRRSITLGLILFGIPILLWGWQILKTRNGAGHARISTFLLLALCALLPPLISFFASRVLSQSYWGSRYLIFTAAPYLLLVAVAVCRMRPGWLRPIAVALVLVWAGASGFVFLSRTDRRIAWDTLVSNVREAVPAEAAGEMIYSVGYYVSSPMNYYLDQANETRFRVVKVGDKEIKDITADHFWVAFRDKDWKLERQPQTILADSGYTVGAGFTVSAPDEHVALFPVWKQETNRLAAEFQHR